MVLYCLRTCGSEVGVIHASIQAKPTLPQADAHLRGDRDANSVEEMKVKEDITESKQIPEMTFCLRTQKTILVIIKWQLLLATASRDESVSTQSPFLSGHWKGKASYWPA